MEKLKKVGEAQIVSFMQNEDGVLVRNIGVVAAGAKSLAGITNVAVLTDEKEQVEALAKLIKAGSKK